MIESIRQNPRYEIFHEGYMQPQTLIKGYLIRFNTLLCAYACVEVLPQFVC